MTEYMIQDELDSSLYWSNDVGWTDIETADIFTDKDYNLPIGGKWIIY